MKNLLYTIQEYKLNRGIVTTEHDQQYLQWMIRGLKKLRQMEIYEQCVKSTQLFIDKTTNTANLPADYQDYLQIGICCGNVFINFDKNPTLCDGPIPCPCSNDEIQAQVQTCCSTGQFGTGYNYPIFAYPFWGDQYSWSTATGSYAQGPGFYSGGYKLNLKEMTIKFDHCVKPDSVILVYFGDVTDDCGNALVTDDIVDCLINWAEWQRQRFMPVPVMGLVQMARNTWFQSARDIVTKSNKLNRAEWFKLIRRFEYSGVKA